MISDRAAGTHSTSSLPASARERSSRSSIKVRRCRPFRMIMSLRCEWRSGSALSVASSSAAPSIAVSGVRISWLTFARKALFARLAASAVSFAFCSSSAARLRSVISVEMPHTA